VSTETVIGPLAETVGLIYVDSRFEVGEITAGNQEILQTLALEASTVIENARLLEEERAKKRMDEELRIARNIQRSLRPASLPRSGWFRVAASSDPSLQVGGDYYDVTRVSPECWVFVVADVSGKGVSSALLASLLQGALISAPGDPAGIERLLRRTNAYVYERAEGEKYATLFYGAMHSCGTLYYCAAGHGQTALLLPDGSVEDWGAASLPLGMLPEGEFPVATAHLAPGTKLVIYSDGLTDAENRSGESFGTKRVRGLFAAGGALDAPGLHRHILDAVGRFAGDAQQKDDLTVMVAEYAGHAG
jgi:serine phosphatase RsbU (regulator of sigma subunit)